MEKKHLRFYYKHLCKMMEDIGLDDKEIIYRKRNLEKAFPKDENIEDIDHRFYELVHEIKAMSFLSNLGKVKVARDSVGEPGCDCIFAEKYDVEFVCCSLGKHPESFKTVFQESFMKDYKETAEFILSRLTNSVKYKTEKYLSENSIGKRDPFIIFLGLGELSYGAMLGSYGMEILSFLVGKGERTFSVDLNTGEVIRSGYVYKPDFKKPLNGATIKSDIWGDESYNCVSALIVSDADVDEDYSFENTWMFINPNAHNKIIIKDFWGIIYWKNKGEENTPYKKYRKNDII